MSSGKVRPEEKECAELLKAFLVQRGMPCTWGPGSDPPDLDFRVTVNGQAEKWAVEVTGLFQYFDQDGEETTRLSFEVPIRKIVDRMSHDLSGQINGSYVVSASGPFLEGVISNLYKRLRAYIESGRTDPEELHRPEAVAAQKKITKHPDPTQVQWVIDSVVNDRPNKITVKRIGEGRSLLLLSGHGGAEKLPKHDPDDPDDPFAFVANVDKMLAYGTKRVLNEKLPKMAKVQGYDRKMLLVWDQMFIPKAPEVGASFKAHSLEGIDGIFFVESFANKFVKVVAKAEIVPA